MPVSLTHLLKGFAMIRKTAVLLAILMLSIVAWGLFIDESSTRIIINGHELTGPFQGAGAIIGLTALFCASILLLFVFAGIGIFLLGILLFASLIVAWLAFPLLLFLLLPLAIVWLFIALTRKSGT
jgi:hypothetical protein